MDDVVLYLLDDLSRYPTASREANKQTNLVMRDFCAFGFFFC